MTPAAASGHDSFTRIAHHNYNAVSRRYEYASLDTRAPQMMTYEAGTNSSMRAQDGVMLQGGTFVAPQWGEASNITFEYRLQISEIEQSRQSVRLYLKRLRGEDAEEFLAFEYVYTRRH